MASLTDCPTPEVLECLLLGRLSAAEADQVEAHLEVCPTCLRLASAMPAEDEIVHAMRAAREPLVGPDDTSIVEALCQWLTCKSSSATELPSSQCDSAKTATFTAAGAGLALDAPVGSGPEMLGRFRLLRQLGAGGMGVVWLAFDPRLGRQVALKVIHPRRANNPEAVGQFLDEAKAMAAVKSDHIIEVYDADEDNGNFYLAMPLLRGETLESRLRRTGRQPLAEVLRIGREIALGLAAAHARDLIHRDIKPSNIWLEEPGDGSPGRSRVKILDFGLSCMLTDVAGRSVPGGTPAYMAPEQAIGQPVDFRADMFSLGCVLYFLAAGVPPFVSSDYLATIVQVASVEPPPPRKVNPAVPHRLDELIRRLMAKKADQRLASAGQVIQILEEIENAGELARRRRSRRRWLLGVSLGLAVACGLTAYLTWYHAPVKIEERIQVEEVVPRGRAVLELEPGDWSVVLSHDNEDYPVDRKEKGPLELPAGEYKVRLSKPRGKQLRPLPDTFTVPENKEVTVPIRLIGEEAVYAGHPGPVRAVALAPSGLWNLSGGDGDLEIILWDPISDRVEPLDKGIEKKHEAGVGCLAFAPDGKRVASGEKGKQKAFPENGFAIWLWDLDRKTGDRLGVMSDHVTALAWRPPLGRELLVGDGGGEVRLWDVSRRESICLGSHKRPGVSGIAVSADGTRAVSAGLDRKLIVWDLRKQKPAQELHPLPAARVHSVALTTDGRTAVAGCEDGLIHVWDLETGKERTLTGHKGAVNGVALSADAGRLVSGGADGTLRLWDLVRSQEIEAFREQRKGQILAVALTADGKYALTANQGGSLEGGRVHNAVRLWRLP